MMILSGDRDRDRAMQRRHAATLRSQERVVSDEKILLWRRRQLVALGFTMGEAQTLSVRGEADLHEIADWLDQGATTGQVLRILARPVEFAIDADIDISAVPDYPPAEPGQISGGPTR